MKRDIDYLTTKQPWKALLVFMLPIMIGNLFQKFYITVDSVIVGRMVGEDALAAIGACNALTNVFICVAIGGGVGASVIVGRNFGAHRYADMKTAVSTAILSFLALSMVMGALGLFGSRLILTILGTPEKILDEATAYLQIYFLGFPFLFLYNVLSAVFNSLGKSRIPLGFLIFSSLLNIGLDYFFVAVLGMGVEGVAWGTLIAQGLSAALSFAVFLRVQKQISSERGQRFDGTAFKEMARIALPSILQQSTITIGYLFVQAVVNSFDTEVMAGFSAAMRVEGVCVTFMTSAAVAMSTFTAQNLGAGKPERVPQGLKAALTLGAAVSALVAVFLVGMPEGLTRIFLGDECSEAALTTAVQYMGFTGAFYMLFAIKQAVDGVLRGSGDTLVFTIANLINLGIRVLVAVIMAPKYGVAWVAYAVPIGWAVNSVISYWEYRTGRWKQSLSRRASLSE